MKPVNRVLIVEDSILFSNLLKKSLNEIVEEITQVYTFRDAKKALEEEYFDYIFLDLILPDGEGDELIELLPAKIRNKTIVLTGESDVEKRDYLFKLGILEYFSKINPINLIINDIKNLLKDLEENKNFNVLIIDDSSFIRKTLKNILKPRKYNLFFAKNAKEGEEILNSEEIHLIFLDIELPDKNGVEFLEEIKKEEKFLDIPVISISNNDDPVVIARLLKHGAKDFVKKPFIAEYLVLKCDLHLKNYRNILLLKEKNEEIRKLNRIKSEFFSSMSHEIRTPLNAVNGFIKLLLKMKLPDETKKYIKILNSTVDDLLRIINDLLDFEKAENKKLEIENIEFSLNELLNEISEIYTQKAKEHGIDFHTEFVNTDKYIISDPTRIKQIINNLLSNAFKFTPKGKKVTLRVVFENEKLFIEVEDEGVGIENNKIKTILEPFSQADKSISREFGGTGLGLSIVKKIAELLGGSIDIKSEVGKGSVFRVEIPVKTVKNRKLNILVAEDDPANRIFIEAILKHLGHKCKIVENGKEALDEFKKNRYDAVILDNNMPKMKGSEVLQEIKKISNITVISISGSECKGFDYSISKPFTPEKFEAVLKSI